MGGEGGWQKEGFATKVKDGTMGTAEEVTKKLWEVFVCEICPEVRIGESHGDRSALSAEWTKI